MSTNKVYDPREGMVMFDPYELSYDKLEKTSMRPHAEDYEIKPFPSCWGNKEDLICIKKKV